MKIDLLAFQQETPHTCLPASIRTVLFYYGHEFSEKVLVEACQANRRGARFDHAVKAVRALGFEVTRIKDGNIIDLLDHLAANQPIIVALGAEYLPYAGNRITHAVVVCGLEGDEVIFVDPSLGKETRLDSLTFFKAWTSRGRSGLVIVPKNGTKG